MTELQARCGPVIGLRCAGVTCFMAIPYARSTRWAPPVPVEAWTLPHDGRRPGPACPQPGRREGSLYEDPDPIEAEDCLHLNIWTPDNAHRAPVMVWIHGGSLIWGSNGQSIYDGAELARQGIVVVSVNYRLGVLGYFAHPELSARTREGVSGNYGLLDQVAALRWVRDTIADFGGDPDQVTIAGESAGALSVLYLMVSPLARGLFHRAIAQSPYMPIHPRLTQSEQGTPSAEDTGLELQRALGASDLDALLEMPAKTLVQSAHDLGFLPWGTIDGGVLPGQLAALLEQGEQAPVPVLAGFNEGELRSLPFLLPEPPQSPEHYRQEIQNRHGPFAADLLARYPEDAIRESQLALLRDAFYGWAAERVIRAQHDKGQDAFLYYFDHGYEPAASQGLHAFHGSELPYVFNALGKTAKAWPAPPGDGREQGLADLMTSYWGAFVKGRLADNTLGPAWPSYGERRSYMRFDGGAQIAEGLHAGAFELHETLYRARLAQGLGWSWNVGTASPVLSEAEA